MVLWRQKKSLPVDVFNGINSTRLSTLEICTVEIGQIPGMVGLKRHS